MSLYEGAVKKTDYDLVMLFGRSDLWSVLIVETFR